LTWCIDVLASRYSWTREYCLEHLYWEEFWEYVIVAANYQAEEKNAEFKFNFMLHADKSSAESWEDYPIPFPEEGSEIVGKKSISEIPPEMQRLVYRPDKK
jgi:hypothetical protein